MLLLAVHARRGYTFLLKCYSATDGRRHIPGHTRFIYGLYAARQENQKNRSLKLWESANLHSALKM